MATTTACYCWWFPLFWGIRWEILVWGKGGASLGLRTSWGTCGIKVAVAEEKMVCVSLHRDQIHRWKRKTSCPTNMLKKKTCSPLTQEPSDWKGLAKISTVPSVESIEEGWTSEKGRSEGKNPVSAVSSCFGPRSSFFWGGDPKGAGENSALEDFTFLWGCRACVASHLSLQVTLGEKQPGSLS